MQFSPLFSSLDPGPPLGMRAAGGWRTATVIAFRAQKDVWPGSTFAWEFV